MNSLRHAAVLLAFASVASAAAADEQSFQVRSRGLATVNVDGGRAAGDLLRLA